MKLRESARTDAEAFKPFVNSLPRTLEYITRTDLDKCQIAFNAQGIECEGIDDIYYVLNQLASLGLIEVEIDHKDRVRKYKGLYVY
jgi:hypothetical protein